MSGARCRLEVELDPEIMSSTFLAAGALVDALDSFVADGLGPFLPDGHFVLAESDGEHGGRLSLRGPGRAVALAGAGPE